MSDENKINLQYFEASSMKDLYNQMRVWQVENRKRLLSISIEHDQDSFCCIALTNPTEVIIVDGTESGGVSVFEGTGGNYLYAG